MLGALGHATLAWQLGREGAPLSPRAPRPGLAEIRAPRCAPCGCEIALFRKELLTLAGTLWPPWPNGQGVGLLIRRLRVRVPQGMLDFQRAEEKKRGQKRDELLELMKKETNPIIGCLV